MRSLLLVLPLVTGCYAFVREGDPTPLPARAWLATRGGQRLDLDPAGGLVIGHAPSDIEGALGVELEQREEGVTVAAVRSSTDGAVVLLEPGDVVLAARGVAPWLPEDLSATLQPTAVRDLEDLRGLAVGLPGLGVELRVRRGETEALVRQPLRAPALVATRPWAPELAAPLGVELVRLDDWPTSRLPVGAAQTDYLVTRVRAGSHGAAAGLRPLDVVVNAQGRFDVLMSTLAGQLPPQLEPVREQLEAALQEPGARLTTVRAPDGREKALELVPARAPRDTGLPLLLGYESNDLRTHVGLLPFDWLFHRHVTTHYDPLSDSMATSARWSFLTLLQVSGLEGGSNEALDVRLDVLVDEPRTRYALDRIFGDQSP